MANLLLLGSARQIEQFSLRINDGHHVYLPDSISEDMPAMDAVFELAVNRHDKERNLAALRAPVLADAPVFVNALTMTATAAAAHLGASAPVIGISYTAGTFQESTLLEVAPALQNMDVRTTHALELLRLVLPLDIEVVADRVGLVSMRVLAMIINEAAFALMEGVANAGDIDTAMKLGTNYPKGPLAWADAIGIDDVLAVLQALYEEYQEERYRPCVLLKQYARAGMGIAG